MTRASRETRTTRPAAKRRPARAVAERPANRRHRASGETPYHHGDLHDALLAAAERVLEREGLPGLTLRAVAREAGVSHAAPTHHFGDLSGLLSELAAIGLRRLTAAQHEALEAAGPRDGDRARAIARTYLRFGIAHPGLTVLMSRGERLDTERPALRDAIAEASGVLDDFIASRHPADDADALTLAAELTAFRSLIHGFTVLFLDGRLDRMLASLPERPPVETFFDAVLDVVHPATGPGGRPHQALS